MPGATRRGVKGVDRWSELRTVLCVAEHGTVSAAAATLGYHRATVNRHVDVLEAEIGARIFIRHAKGYTLTEIGEEVLRVAKATRTLTQDLSGHVRGKTDRIDGELRLSIVAPFAALIMRAVDGFTIQHPECRVLINTTNDMLRLEHGEAHVAIRAGRKPRHPDYVVKSLKRVDFGLYAHEDYRSRFGLPDTTQDLSRHRFILRDDRDGKMPFSHWIEQHVQPRMVALVTDDVWTSVEAICHGVGIGFLADHETQTRTGLHRVLDVKRSWYLRLWLTTHVDLHRSAKVQAISKHIRSAFMSGDRNAGV